MRKRKTGRTNGNSTEQTASVSEDNNAPFKEIALDNGSSIETEDIDGNPPDILADSYPALPDEAYLERQLPAPLPKPQLVEPIGDLLVHCGARKITRAELALIPAPPATRTHQPIAHHRIVEALEEALSFRHITAVREEYAVAKDGARMFGVLDLNTTWNDVRFSIGLRNSNDKSMRLGMTIGFRVMVCDNMAFRGDFAPVFHKHTRKLDLLETISIGVDKMQRGFEPLKMQINEWRESMISDDAARVLIYRAFLEERFPRKLIAEVHRQYFKPEYAEFASRTLWSLSNAFTSAFKQLKPVQQFTATARLGSYLQAHQSLLSVHHDHRIDQVEMAEAMVA